MDISRIILKNASLATNFVKLANTLHINAKNANHIISNPLLDLAAWMVAH